MPWPQLGNRFCPFCVVYVKEIGTCWLPTMIVALRYILTDGSDCSLWRDYSGLLVIPLNIQLILLMKYTHHLIWVCEWWQKTRLWKSRNRVIIIIHLTVNPGLLSFLWSICYYKIIRKSKSAVILYSNSYWKFGREKIQESQESSCESWQNSIFTLYNPNT